MKYSKLVRDKIPKIIMNNGEKPIFHIANNIEFKDRLYKKLEEEMLEFYKDDNVEELADILEVIYAICDIKGIARDDLESVRKDKVRSRGCFDNKIILDEVL